MLNYFKFIEILISLQSFFISSMIPFIITNPFNNNIKYSLELPITLQVPVIILISLIFKSRVVFSALSIYLLIGLFIIPVFYEGGSLGYLLSPNFGYLIGYYPLIKIINYLKKNKKIYIFTFKISMLAIFFMHLTGIFYSFLQQYITDNSIYFYII